MILNRTEIEQRKQYLTKLISEVNKRIAGRPQGSVRAVKHGNGFQYYLRESANDINGRYIQKKDLKTISPVIQREYEERVVSAAREELRILSKAERICEIGTAEEQYYRISEGKRRHVKPIVETKEHFLNRILHEEYERLSFKQDSPEFYNDQGIRVRSKSEVLLSNMLIKLEIPFLYERPVTLSGNVVLHPDFTLIDVENRRLIFWEHFGMTDNEEYANNAFDKIRLYEKAGYYLGVHLLITEERLKKPLDIKHIEKKLNALLKNTG